MIIDCDNLGEYMCINDYFKQLDKVFVWWRIIVTDPSKVQNLVTYY